MGQRVRERLFNENTVETAISRRRSSCVHFEDEKIIMLNKDRTFQIGTFVIEFIYVVSCAF